MDGASTSERTPLMGSPPAPSYVFSSATARNRQDKLRRLQCCICFTLIFAFFFALVITITYSLDHPTDDDNTTIVDITNGSLAMTTLLQLSWPITDPGLGNWSASTPMGESDLEEAGRIGTHALEMRIKFEALSTGSGAITRPPATGSPTHRAQLALASLPPSVRLTRAGYAKDHATKHFVKNKPFRPNWCIGRGPTINASWTLPECSQSLHKACPPAKYRSINGTCNNLRHPIEWGVAFTPFRRVLQPDYADGVSAPRIGHNGVPLPSARDVSLQVHRPVYRADPEFTVVLAVWGQFFDHDITATALNQGVNGSAISCCEAYDTPGLRAHPECFPVLLSPEDPNNLKYNVSCMNFVRSAPAPSCSLGPREQLNQASAYIDGSTVYGSYEDVTNSLRQFEGGELLMLTTKDGRELLPASYDPKDGCNEKKLNAQGKYCFVSGDVRANENLHLTTMHLLWARQHNRLARWLAKLNPHWDDEDLFQESRRIIGAQMQHITYNEFLPVLLGNEAMEKLELSPKMKGYYHGYNSSVNPNIANHFASSAFRFAHTLLPTLMKMVNGENNVPEYVHLHKMLFNPYSLYAKHGVDDAIRGAMQTDMQRVDSFFTPELTSHLFKRDEPLESETNGTAGRKPLSPCGLDLVSLNIQRGRDHGLPSYPAWREHCGFKRPKSFDDFKDLMDPDSLKRISSIFKNVEDVDLYTASLSEIPLQDSVLGATVTCLLLDQFVRLKRGDRYWYESPEKPHAFTEEQLNEIRKTTLAGIICDNGDSLDMAQRYVMRSVGADNPLLNCTSIPSPDLVSWTERPKRIQPSTVTAGVPGIMKDAT